MSPHPLVPPQGGRRKRSEARADGAGRPPCTRGERLRVAGRAPTRILRLQPELQAVAPRRRQRGHTALVSRSAWVRLLVERGDLASAIRRYHDPNQCHLTPWYPLKGDGASGPKRGPTAPGGRPVHAANDCESLGARLLGFYGYNPSCRPLPRGGVNGVIRPSAWTRSRLTSRGGTALKQRREPSSFRSGWIWKPAFLTLASVSRLR